MEQKVTIQLKSPDNLDLGELIIIAETKKPFVGQKYKKFPTKLMAFENVPMTDEPDDVTPIQYNSSKEVEPGARIMLLEETEYQVMFTAKPGNKEKLSLFPTLLTEDEFKDGCTLRQWSLDKEDVSRARGFLNFHSYVGKSFFDVKVGNAKSTWHPFEVRSKKIGYREQYPAMISDLSNAASGLLFERKSPLFQKYDFSETERSSMYEHFMFLEYVFKEENLPQAYEHVRRNIYNQLEKFPRSVPVSLACNVGPREIYDIISNPEKLVKPNLTPEHWPIQMNGYVPDIIEERKCRETIDTPENRLIKHLLLLMDELIYLIQQSNPKGYIEERVASYHQTIQDFLSDDWLQNIGPLEIIPSNSQVLQKREGYRDIFQLFLNFTFSFSFKWEEMDDLIKGYNRRLSELYEYWCYFKLVSVFNELAITPVNYEDLFEISEDKWSINVKRGNKSVQKLLINIEGKPVNVQLMYNKLFSRHTKHDSYSLPFKPDYSVLVNYNENVSFIHFDAKYRSEVEVMDFYDRIGREKRAEDDELAEEDTKEVESRDTEEQVLRKFKDGDLYKMHTYKDAILKSEGAYILYPGDRDKLFRVDENEEIPSVGAFPLTPGKDEDAKYELKSFIKAVLKKLIQ